MADQTIININSKLVINYKYMYYTKYFSQDMEWQFGRRHDSMR